MQRIIKWRTKLNKEQILIVELRDKPKNILLLLLLYVMCILGRQNNNEKKHL